MKSSVDFVAGSASSQQNFETLNKEIIACRKCPRLVAWREEVALPNAKLIKNGIIGASRYRGLEIAGRACWWWDSHPVRTVQTGPAANSLEMVRVVFCFLRCTVQVLRARPNRPAVMMD